MSAKKKKENIPWILARSSCYKVLPILCSGSAECALFSIAIDRSLSWYRSSFVAYDKDFFNEKSPLRSPYIFKTRQTLHKARNSLVSKGIISVYNRHMYSACYEYIINVPGVLHLLQDFYELVWDVYETNDKTLRCIKKALPVFYDLYSRNRYNFTSLEFRMPPSVKDVMEDHVGIKTKKPKKVGTLQTKKKPLTWKQLYNEADKYHREVFSQRFYHELVEDVLSDPSVPYNPSIPMIAVTDGKIIGIFKTLIKEFGNDALNFCRALFLHWFPIEGQWESETQEDSEDWAGFDWYFYHKNRVIIQKIAKERKFYEPGKDPREKHRLLCEEANVPVVDATERPRR